MTANPADCPQRPCVLVYSAGGRLRPVDGETLGGGAKPSRAGVAYETDGTRIPREEGPKIKNVASRATKFIQSFAPPRLGEIRDFQTTKSN